MSLSVLQPLHNIGSRSSYTLEALKKLDLPSIRSQVYILDDGSTDNSTYFYEDLNLIRDMTFHRAELNSGRSKARNTLAKLATGDWLIFVDGDCILEPEFVVLWLEILEDRKPDHCILGRVQYEKIENSGITNYLNKSTGPWRLKNKPEILEHKFFATGHICIPAKAFKEVGGFNEEFINWGGEDFDLGRRLHEAGYPLKWQEDVTVSHPKINDFEGYLKRFEEFSQQSLPKLLSYKSTDLFGINKWGASPLFFWAKLKVVPCLLKHCLKYDRILWPAFMYKLLFFSLALRGVKKANR